MQHPRCIPRSGASRSARKTEPNPFPKSFHRYSGGKSSLRRKFIGKILENWNDGVDREYREPFLGGGSVAWAVLSDPRVKRAWLNDFDTSVAAQCIAVQSRPDDLCKTIRACQPSADEFYRLKDYFKMTPVSDQRSADPVELGVAGLLLRRISHNGNGMMAGGPQGGRNGGNKIFDRWNPEELCRRIRILHRLISSKNVRFTTLDFETMLTAPGDCVHYNDPPYVKAGPELYQYPFFEADHIRLRDALRRCHQPWVLSYDPAARPLYDFANIEVINSKELIITPRDK
jgi:DNA adenine methylase